MCLTKPDPTQGPDFDEGAQLDDYRNRTLAFCALLNYLREKISAQSGCRSGVSEWLRFLHRLDRAVPDGAEVHLIASNGLVRKDSTVRAWLRGHPRFLVHCPTSGGMWMSEIERFFSERNWITAPPDSANGMSELSQNICHFLADPALSPQDYIWTAERISNRQRTEQISSVPPASLRTAEG
jgi:putative transposase